MGPTFIPKDALAWALRQFSLDPQPEQSLKESAADVALGFVPGVGQAMALRDMERARRAGDPVAGGLAAASLVPWGRAVGPAAKIIAGKTAKYFPKVEAAAAEGMEQAGHDPASVWRTTGIERQPEGQLGFEIPDQPAKVNVPYEPSGHFGGRVSDFVEHPELFKNYPEVADWHMYGRLHPGETAEGSFHSNVGTPGMPEIIATGKTPDEIRDAVLHEIQHGVQHLEGWDPGANFGHIRKSMVDALRGTAAMNDPGRVEQAAARKYLSNIGESQSRMVEKRSRMSPEFLKKVRPEEHYDISWENMIPERDLPGY